MEESVNVTTQQIEFIPTTIGQYDIGPTLSNTTEGNLSSVWTAEYEYEYDYDESVSDLPMYEIVPVTIVYSLTLVLGVIGNVLVIFSISHYRRMQNVTNIFLTSLATADLLLVLLCVPIKLAKWFSFSWTFGLFLCKFVHYMQNVSVICSILTLTAISLERYYAILYPMKAKYMFTTVRARKSIALLWIVSLLLATPIIFGQTHKEVGVLRKAFWCVKEWGYPWHSQLYEVGMLCVVFVMPLALMGFAYSSISREMWRITSSRMALRAAKYDHNSNKDRRERRMSEDRKDSNIVNVRYRRVGTVKDDAATRKQVIKMLVAIILLFSICWGPILIDNVLVSFGILDQLHYGHLKPMRMAFSLMAYTNSCVNPIVYAFMSKNFRQCFHITFMSILRRSRRHHSGIDDAHALRRDSCASRRPSATTMISAVRPTFVKMESGSSLLTVKDLKELKETSLSPNRKTSVSVPPVCGGISEESWAG